jgi:hypothetical protein
MPLSGNTQDAISYLTYGNEASQTTAYSYAAIIAVIPSWTDRRQLLEKIQNE